MGEAVSGVASPEFDLIVIGELLSPFLGTLSEVSSFPLKLETLLMLMTFFISLRVALGVALPLVSPGVEENLGFCIS